MAVSTGGAFVNTVQFRIQCCGLEVGFLGGHLTLLAWWGVLGGDFGGTIRQFEIRDWCIGTVHGIVRVCVQGSVGCVSGREV